MTNSCANCRYFFPAGEESNREIGDCRRYPPRVVQFSIKEGVESAHPIVSEDEWCGEWASVKGADPNAPRV
jgi:hypothetical protein